MRFRSRLVALAGAALIMLALPVQAQDGGSTVSFDGIGFSFDRALGRSVNITQVRGQPANDQELGAPDARHLAFVLYGPKSESAKLPRVIDASGAVRVYDTADLAPYDFASHDLKQLRTLLANRPDLGTFMKATADGSVKVLPFLPVFEAGQAIHARAHYVDTPQLSGIAYLTVFRQDVSPFAAGDFWYTFQGISTDGAHFIAVTFIVNASMFPDRVSFRDSNRIANRWGKYISTSTATLNAAAPDAFSPSLTSIDALVQSITFEGIPASEPSPLVSPAPSPLASAPG